MRLAAGAVASKRDILGFSVVHQLALLALGALGAALGGTRWWIPASSYGLVGIGMWATHWAGHRRIIPGWFEFHTMGHHVKSCAPSACPRRLTPPPPPPDAAARQVPPRFLGALRQRRGHAPRYAALAPRAKRAHTGRATGVAAAHRALLDAGAAEIAPPGGVGGADRREEFIHEQVHLRGRRWRAALVGTLRALHFLHHRDEHHNYAMCDFLYDFLSGI